MINKFVTYRLLIDQLEWISERDFAAVSSGDRLTVEMPRELHRKINVWVSEKYIMTEIFDLSGQSEGLSFSRVNMSRRFWS